MNEPEMPVAPPAAPPSYLRPPAVPSSSEMHSSLALLGGVVALIAIGVLTYLYVPFKSSSVLPSDTLAFFVREPTPGLYTYSFATQEVAPVDVAGAVEGLSAQWASFSPHADFYVQHSIKKEGNTPLLTVGNLRTGKKYYLGSADSGARFDWPIVSNDGKYVAYNFFYSMPTAKTKADLAKGKGELVPISTLAYASLEDGVFTAYPLAAAGTPLLFSPDQTKLLVRQFGEFSLVSLADSTSAVVSGTPIMSNAATVSVALSKDTRAFAVAVHDTIYWGRFDWGTGTFLQEGMLEEHADALSFGSGGELLYLREGKFYSYRISDGKKQDIIVPTSFSSFKNIPFVVLTPIDP
ncbi:MAG: hypothetical protein Q7R54_00440 [bacterium]|nr:hypothetical protein [bacterium]